MEKLTQEELIDNLIKFITSQALTIDLLNLYNLAFDTDYGINDIIWKE